MNNWNKHPIAQNLAVYSNSNNNNNIAWTTVASDINIEYRRLYIQFKIVFIYLTLKNNLNSCNFVLE